MRGERSIAVWAALVVLVGISLPAPARGNDPGVSVANYTESRGCEPGLAGPVRPYVSTMGTMSLSDQIRGPWGDMFGRTYDQVRNSLVWWQLPGSNKSLQVHERVLPALERAAVNLNSYLVNGKSYNVYSAFAWIWRTVRGRTQVSEHALGSAFDINPSSNPYSEGNYLQTDIPDWFVASFVDAGFCWGGNWVDVKDPMHFSWSGPVLTPNYPGRPAPYPPVTSTSNYRGSTLSLNSRISVKAGSVVTLGDVTGEGAPDLVQLSASGRVEAAGAIGDYGQIAMRDATGTGSSNSVLGDYDLDGRPDVWVPDRSGSTIRFDVWTWGSGFDQSISISTAAPSSSTHVMLGLYDDDFLPDLYVYNGSSFSVYGSKNGYGSVVTQINMPVGADSSWHFSTGDHDLDGKSDIYAVSNGQEPSLRISTAAGSFATFSPAVPVTEGSAVDFGDYDGDGREDMFVLTGSSLTIALGGNSLGAPDAWFQNAGSVPHDAGPECTGSGCDTIGYVDYGGIWSIADLPRSAPSLNEFYFGNPGDSPFSGDWNCDGADTPGLYRRTDGFVYLRNSNTQGIADLEFYFGDPGDIPLVGDFDGDGCDTVSVFRPSERRMYIINELGEDGAGLGSADFSFTFGESGDLPFVGDFDGDGADEIALYRQSSGRMYLKWDLAGGDADASFVYGLPGDIPVAGDWNGDGMDTVAVYRPSANSWFIKLSNSGGSADHVIHLHTHTRAALPIAGRMGE
ncbi:MAG: hypothetical protein BMS9Abin12_2205 [Acidimicrobiia bacterium]|nr:MAG: hypothetical protein BMS9Abin12_2205 [Acidimicrobiia bacterium]